MMSMVQVFNTTETQFPDLEEVSPFGVYFPEIYNIDFAYPINGIIIPILAIIVLVTNVLFVIVFIKGKMDTPTHVYLRFMAVFDMITVVLPTPCFMYMYMFGNYKEYVPYELCVVWEHFTLYLPTMTHTASIWLTVGLAIQRFMCVRYPLSMRLWCRTTTTYIVVFVITFLAIGCHFTLFLEKDTERVRVYSKLNPNQIISGCIPKYREWIVNSGAQYFIAYYWCRAFLVQIIPCFAMALFNGIIFRKIRQAEKKRQKLRSQSTLGALEHREHKVTTWLVIIIVNSVLIVELPIRVFLALYAYMISSGSSIIPQTAIQPAEMVLNLLVLFTYPLHFVMYSCMSSSFRLTLKRILRPISVCTCRRESREFSESTRGSVTEVSQF